jgi:hypothetical protein
MNQNKEYHKKCLICGSNDWIKRDVDEDGNLIVCNMCGFTY